MGKEMRFTGIRSDFLKCNSQFKVIMGPVGSGKSTACCADIIKRCSEQTVSPDGYRYSRWAVVGDGIRAFRDVAAGGGVYVSADKIFKLRFGNARADILFIDPADKNDIRTLCNVELTGAWIVDLQDVDAAVISSLFGRVGRYPAQRLGGPAWYGVIAETNAPKIGSYWHRVFEDLDTGERAAPMVAPHVFRQPSALSESAENKENLCMGYYERISKNDNAAWVDTYIHGVYA